MADNGNGKFLRGVFWALLIGSFGWTTFVGFGLANSMASQAKDAQDNVSNLRCEISNKLDKILDITTTIKTMQASDNKQIEVNSKRLDKLERR